MNQLTALLIIDVQLGMFEENDPVYAGEILLQTIQSLIDRAHQNQTPIIYVQHIGSEGHPLEPSAPGWPIHPAIQPAVGEPVVHKKHPDSFQDTKLQALLKANNIQRLIVAGIQTDYCVDTTCRRAYSLGYEVVLVEDGHSTWDAGGLTAEQIIAHHNLVIGDWFATLKPAAEIDFA